MPAEIRFIIWNFCQPSREELETFVTYANFKLQYETLETALEKVTRPLLCTNRQTRAESLPLFRLRTLVFLDGSNCALMDFFDGISTRQKRQIGGVRVNPTGDTGECLTFSEEVRKRWVLAVRDILWRHYTGLTMRVVDATLSGEAGALAMTVRTGAARENKLTAWDFPARDDEGSGDLESEAEER